MFSFFANIFGYILNFLYNLVNNYGLAIILFTVIIKLAMLPLSIKQQKSLKKNTKIQKEMQIIQFKYKNDPEKMNQAVMKLYKDNNVSPFSGCLGSILQLILLLSVFYMVASPLTYMEKIPADSIKTIKEQLSSEQLTVGAYAEIDIIRNIDKINNVANQPEEKTEAENTENSNETAVAESNNGAEAVENNNDAEVAEGNSEGQASEDNNKAEVAKVNDEDIQKIKNLKEKMNFLGLDLNMIPQQNMNNFAVYIIPALYILSTFISMRLTVKMQENMKAAQSADSNEVIINKEKDNDNDEDAEKTEEDPMMQTNKMMSWMMPILSISIAFVAPLGLALYWLANNVTMIIERIILDKFIKMED